MSIKRAFIVFVVCVLDIIPAQAQWKQTSGPQGGPISCLATNSTTLFAGIGGYAGMAYRGIYRSVDNGDSWTLCGLSDYVVSSIAVVDSIVIVATYNDIIFRSTNNGTSWDSAALDKIRATVYLCGKTFFISSSDGRNFRSSDNGATWIPMNFSNKSHLYSGNDSLIVAANGKDNVLKFSTTQGRIWDSTLTPKNIGLLCYDTKLLYYVSTNGYIFRSTDKGKTWSDSSLFPQYTVVHLASNGRTLFAITDGYGAFRSADSGNTWTEMNIDYNKFELTYQSFVLCNTDKPIYVVKSWCVFQSYDNGDTWAPIKSNGMLLRETALETYNSEVFVGTNGGLFRSSDKGATWVRTGYTSYVQQVAVTDSFMIIAGGTPYRSIDNGKIWMRSTYDSPIFPGECSGFAVTSGGLFMAQRYSDATTGRTEVYKSATNGAVWKPLNFQAKAAKTYSEAFSVNGDTLFVGTNGLGIFRSTDFGETWENVFCCEYVYTFWLQGNVLFTGTNKGILRSTDGGVTWLHVGQPKIGAFDFARYGTSLFAVWSGIWRSDDNGETWYDVSGELPKSGANTIAIVGTTIFVGTSFMGVWKAEIADLVPSAVNEFPLQSTKEISLYPNPAQDEVTIVLPEHIRYTTPIRGRLLTVDGKIAREFIVPDVPSDTFTLQLNGIDKGVYALELCTGAICRYSTIIVYR